MKRSLTAFQAPTEADVILSTILKSGLVDSGAFLQSRGFRVSIGGRTFDLIPEEDFRLLQRIWVAKNLSGKVIDRNTSIYNLIRELKMQLLIS